MAPKISTAVLRNTVRRSIKRTMRRLWITYAALIVLSALVMSLAQ